MELIPAEQFLHWAATNGIEEDPRHAAPRCLIHGAPMAARRFWNVPRNPRDAGLFYKRILVGMTCTEALYLWPRGGVWPEYERPHSRVDEAFRLIRLGPEIPGGYAGAVKYKLSEIDFATGQMALHLRDGFCVHDDLHVVPDTGRQIIQTDHHRVVHVACVDEPGMTAFLEHMAVGGYRLPGDLPDETFKKPGWI